MRVRLLVSCERRGSTSWLCADGIDCDLPGGGPAAAAVDRRRSALPQRDPCAATGPHTPSFRQVFADPCRPTALALLKLHPHAQAMALADVETLAAKLHELAPRTYGLATAQQLVRLGQHSVRSGVALSARSTSLKILCDQLEQTQANLAQLEQELENLLKTDAGAKGEASCSRICKQDACHGASGVGGCRSLCVLAPGGSLCRTRYRSQAEREMEGRSPALQARQRAYSAYPVSGRRTHYPTPRLRLWILFPSPGGSWPQRACSDDGGDAQDVGCGLSTLENPADV
jgi:hypothetical protein